jgi:ankyrin repeat protein
MHTSLLILLITTCICASSSIHGMKRNKPESTTTHKKTPIHIDSTQINFTQYTAPYLPQETVAHIAGYCQPKEKNILMRLCKYFDACLKNRELIVRVNPHTVSLHDKEKDTFKYTYANNVVMIEFLIENGVDVNSENILGKTLFHVARLHIAIDNEPTKAMQLLTNLRAYTEMPEPQTDALHEAAYAGDEKTIATLCSTKNIDLNLTLNHKTPLFIAAHEGHVNIVQLLLNAGAKPDTANKDKDTPLHVATLHGHTNVVESLLHANAHVDLTNVKNVTALGVAAYYGYTEIVRLLIDKKADVNYHANKHGWTPLYIASLRGHIDIVRSLLNAKAKIDQTTKNEKHTALHAASHQGHTEIVQVLIDKNANVNQADIHGCTPLCIAAHTNRIAIVALLLDHGADIHAIVTVDSKIDPIIKEGDTALAIAQKKGHMEIVKLLEERLEQNTKKEKQTEKCKIL